MPEQSEYQLAYDKRLATIESDPALTILSSMNRPLTPDAKTVQQYIVYTDFKPDAQSTQSRSVYVYTPFQNVDKYGHSKADYQAQLLFELNRWDKAIHLTVMETLGSESRLAFYDFQDLGLAQLGLKALLGLAQKNNILTIDGNISSFDQNNLAKLEHIFQKYDFDVMLSDPTHGIGKIQRVFAH